MAYRSDHVMKVERFRLAPMSGIILSLTIALFFLPLAFFGAAVWSRGTPLLIGGVFVSLIYLLVWLYFRPTRFELSAETFTIVWPIRRYRVNLSDLRDAEMLSGREFKIRYGRAFRIGAGGLWGGFGLMLIRGGRLRFYISRLDGYVLVHARVGRSLLITPERPAEFVRRLKERLGLK
jgi:hypothetical protein